MNIRSLGLHVNELNVISGSFANKPDIIAITESWMRENDDPENYNLEGYQPIESFPRKDAKRRSAGEALYVKTGIRYKTFQLKLQLNVVFLKLNFLSKQLLSASCTGMKNFVCRNFSLT